ncbi:MAG: diacylglycerol/lipid kinase family protein [Eggerthella lenta]
MLSSEGSILLIANPAAQNGNGAAAAQRAVGLLRAQLGGRGRARSHGARGTPRIAERAEGCSTVTALGGDGVIHEVAGGLMRRPAARRPALGDTRRIGQRLRAHARRFDQSGRSVRPAVVPGASCGRRARERLLVRGTLSFGLDAAIALDTMERRRHGRGNRAVHGERHRSAAASSRLCATVSFDGGETVEAESVTFAVQIAYYGGGFKICPDARIDDGLLDVCVAHPPVGAARALYIFLRAKGGKHVRFKQIELRRCRTLHLEFDEAPPAQMDGELIEGTSFDIAVEPAALNVLVPF